MCSLNIVEIPRGCGDMSFQSVFDYCVAQKNMVPIGVYKRHDDHYEIYKGMGKNNDGSPKV